MANKINPKDQTKKIREAKWAFLQRNSKAKKEYEELEMIRSYREWHAKERKKETEMLQSYPEMKEAYDRIGKLPMGECDEDLKEGLQVPTAIGDYRFIEFTRKCPEYYFPEKITDTEINERWLAMLIENATEIFGTLTQGFPAKMLLLGVDLSRSKDVIMAEVKEILELYQKFYWGKETTKTRLKWLSIVDDLLAVWDLYQSYDQRRCFSLIAKKLEISESTVKARWRLAYKLINGKDYTRDQENITADEMCAKCKDQKKCYKIIKGVMEFLPCPAYLKLAGTGYMREKLSENIEKIMSKNAYEDFLKIED